MICLDGIVEVLAGDRLVLEKRLIFFLVELRFSLIGFGAQKLRLRLDENRLSLRQLRFRLSELSRGLIDSGLKRPRIDFEE